MNKFLEDMLKRLARIQKRYCLLIFITTLFITGFFGFGLTQVYLQTDIDKELPQDLPVFKLSNKITNKFGGQDTVLVVIQLDKSGNVKGAPTDIRDPRIIQTLVDLEDLLRDEVLIDNVQSVGSFFKQTGVPPSIDDVKLVLSNIPQAKLFFNKDYSATLLYTSADLGTSEKKTKTITNVIREDISSVSKPPGIKMSLTGAPPMRLIILELLTYDSVYTLLLTAIIILFLLMIMERSINQGLLAFMPLVMSVVWTLGSMGWLNIPLSIATVGVGAMILGLGVEYNVFLLSRYKEERNKNKTQAESLLVAVPGVGLAILGSGITTIIGFMALTLSSLPMLQHLGFTLALGIFYCLFVAVFLSPPMIMLEENFRERWTVRTYKKYSKRMRMNRSLE
ncbi:MAG: MMPL family transporter [Nanoarchaeota archaeon]|nr:MMPL family transporter [Nanoarchaeota archaeon]